jgi:hypothetical protein
MHLSFMPVEYRDFVTTMQKNDNPRYRDQRRNPKVIVPESFHKDGYAGDFTIELEDAPLSHSAVQFCLRDAQYATLGEARRGVGQSVKLRDYVQSHVIPKSALPGQPLPPQQHVFPRYAPPGLPPPVPDSSSASQSRIPLDQRLTTAGQAQVANQFTAAGALNDGFVPPSPSQRSREDDSPNDGFIPPSPSPRRDKGKRGSSYQGSRNQPPTKFSRSDNTSYTSSSNSWRDNSSSRSARPPPARYERSSSKSSIPKPPAPPEQESSSVTQPPPLPAATGGELRYPIPHFGGEYIELFTRDEAKDSYKAVRAKSLPAKGELLSEKDLQRVLNKTSTDISQHDKDMADFIIDRIDDASKQACDYVIEIMVDTSKRYVNIRGESYNERVAVRDVRNLYSLLPPAMIKLVGNYYSVLRQRPNNQGKPTKYEYMPNAKYSYRVVKRNLAQVGIEVLPSRMWVEPIFQNTTDPQLHPYIEWCSGLTLDLPAMEAKIGLSHVPYGTELIDRQTIANAKLRMDSFASVQNFVTLGLIQDDTKQSLLALKATVDEQIKIAKEAKDNNPFVLPQRII